MEKVVDIVTINTIIMDTFTIARRYFCINWLFMTSYTINCIRCNSYAIENKICFEKLRLMDGGDRGWGRGAGWRWGKLSDEWNEIGCAKDQIFLKGCRVQWRGQVWLHFFLTLNCQSPSAWELELDRLNPWRNRDFFFAFTLKSRVSARCKDVKSRTVRN